MTRKGLCQCINNHDSLDDGKDDENYNKEVGGMVSSSPLVTLLRRIGRGPLQTGMDDGSGGMSDNDYMEDKVDRLRGGEWSSINNEDGQVGGTMGVNDDGMGCANATTFASASTSASTTTASGWGGSGY
jgi:hypothetical protein